MKKFFLLQTLFGAILLCYCPHSLSGQNFELQNKVEEDFAHGFVLDEQGEPLPFATIAVWEGERLIGGTSSNEEGFFELKKEGEYIEVTYLGYESRKLKMQELRVEPLVYLRGGVLELEAVVVTIYGCLHSKEIIACGGTISSEHCGGCTFCPSGKQIKQADNKEINPSSFNLLAYPNPTVDFVQISIEQEGGILQLFSSQGHLLKEQKAQSSLCRFDLSCCPAGTYFLRYERAGEAVLSGRVVKVGL